MSSFIRKLERAEHITPGDLPDTIGLARESGLSLLVLGKPGIGKSYGARKYAATTRPFVDNGRDHLLYHETRFSYANPVDVRGWPEPGLDAHGRRSMTFLPPEDYPAMTGSFWHLEEIMNASKTTRNAGMQVLLEKRIGCYECPEDTFIMASGNRIRDYADVETLSAPLMDRFQVVHMDVDHQEWISWAIESELDERVIVFVQFFPQLLHTLPEPGEDGADEWDRESRFATPRSWEMASRYLRAISARAQRPSERVIRAGFQGLLGVKSAGQFERFLAAERELPRLDDIIRHPLTLPVPQDLSARVCLLHSLSSSIGRDRNNVKPFIDFMKRLDREFYVFFLQMAHRVGPSVVTHPAFISAIMEPEIASLLQGRFQFAKKGIA